MTLLFRVKYMCFYEIFIIYLKEELIMKKERKLRIVWHEGLYDYSRGYIDGILDLLFEDVRVIYMGNSFCDKTENEYLIADYRFNGSDEECQKFEKIMNEHDYFNTTFKW